MRKEYFVDFVGKKRTYKAKHAPINETWRRAYEEMGQHRSTYNGNNTKKAHLGYPSGRVHGENQDSTLNWVLSGATPLTQCDDLESLFSKAVRLSFFKKEKMILVFQS